MIIRATIVPTKRGDYVKSYSSREILQVLTADGWYEIACVGDHHQFKHPTKPGKVTLTHPVKDVPIRLLKSIERQAGVKFD
jgi:predicted RNA binding protein YcfA (HicA-like mRNA interferase family)